MLNTILEYRKGILFVRLNGRLVKDTVHFINNRLISIIEQDKLDNIVINVEELQEIDYKGINFIFYIYEMCTKNNGRLLMCGLEDELRKKLKRNRVLNYIKEIENELESFHLIGI